MKKVTKIFSGVVAAATLATGVGSVAVSVKATATLYGDVDNNGVVEMSDYIALGKYLNGTTDLINIDNADVNNNAIISEADYNILGAFMLKKIKVLPYKGN